jgi:soluble lytic murein transglycosylase-like protein
MRKSLLLLLILVVVISLFFMFSESAAAPEPTILVEIQQDIPKTIEELLVDASIKYGINHKRFLATAKCESSLNPDAVGDRGNSFGLFQIHLPSHPDVTSKLATDPEWAIEWSAQKFKKNPAIWTCYRKLYMSTKKSS